jgi:uncharacterized protein (TIGR03083 family)
MRAPGPILVTELFPKLNRELISLLGGLAPEDWQRPTTCSQWNVKDVAAHLLDTSLRRLALNRDAFFGVDAPKLDTERELVNFINEANNRWVQAARHLSPALLIDLLTLSEQQLFDFFKTLDPMAPALFAVSWAGEKTSRVWFDVAREYTEKWHHQEQIREATGRAGLTSREYLFPVLDTFLRALPYAYRSVAASEGTLLAIEISGEAGGAWFLLRKRESWELLLDVREKARSAVRMPQEVAWKLLTKGISKSAAAQSLRVEGDARLGEPFLNMLCIVG